MSLKVFHVLFLVLAVLMLGGFALWTLRSGQYEIMGVLSGVSGLALLVYGMYFLRKWGRLK